MNLKNNRAFTLIELMIVVSIIGILAASAIPKFADLINKTKEAATKGNLASIRSATTIYYATNMKFPGELIGLVPNNMSRLPGASIPTISFEWKENDWVGVDLSGAAKRGDTEASVDAGVFGTGEGTGIGWAYYISPGEVWIETAAIDSAGKAVHVW